MDHRWTNDTHNNNNNNNNNNNRRQYQCYAYTVRSEKIVKSVEMSQLYIKVNSAFEMNAKT